VRGLRADGEALYVLIGRSHDGYASSVDLALMERDQRGDDPRVFEIRCVRDVGAVPHARGRRDCERENHGDLDDFTHKGSGHRRVSRQNVEHLEHDACQTRLARAPQPLPSAYCATRVRTSCFTIAAESGLSGVKRIVSFNTS
jgi:hypothetical protein